MNFLPRQSIYNFTKQMLYLCQILYGTRLLSKVQSKIHNNSQLNSLTDFDSSYIAEFHNI